MNKPIITFVAAIGKNRELGHGGQLPWPHIAEDFKHFHDKTIGRPMIMGRKTYESIGRPLPQRTNIIITRDKNYRAPGCMIAASLPEALAIAKKENPAEIAIIGGAEIFKAALPVADKMYLTVIDAAFPADVYFPDYSEFSKVVSREKHDNGEYKFTFFELERPH